MRHRDGHKKCEPQGNQHPLRCIQQTQTLPSCISLMNKTNPSKLHGRDVFYRTFSTVTQKLPTILLVYCFCISDVHVQDLEVLGGSLCTCSNTRCLHVPVSLTDNVAHAVYSRVYSTDYTNYSVQQTNEWSAATQVASNIHVPGTLYMYLKRTLTNMQHKDYIDALSSIGPI